MSNVASVASDTKKGLKYWVQRNADAANNIVSANSLKIAEREIADELKKVNPKMSDEIIYSILNSDPDLVKDKEARANQYANEAVEKTHPALMLLAEGTGRLETAYDNLIAKISPAVDNKGIVGKAGKVGNELLSFFTGSGTPTNQREIQTHLGKQELAKVWQDIQGILWKENNNRLQMGELPLTTGEIKAKWETYKSNNAEAVKLEEHLQDKTGKGVLEHLNNSALYERMGLGGFVLPQMAEMLLGNVARGFFQSGNKSGAQAAVFATDIIGGIPGMMIGNFVRGCEHLTALPLPVKLLLPFIRMGTILSHNVAPLLEGLRTIVDFDGKVGGKANWFGKALEFIGDGLGLLRFSSMSFFVLNHLNHLMQLKSLPVNERALGSKKLNIGLQWWAIGANGLGAIAGLISSLGMTFALKPKMKELEASEARIEESLAPKMELLSKQEEALKAKYGPILEKVTAQIMPKLQKQALAIKQAVESGKLSMQEAQSYIQALLMQAQSALDKQLPAEYKQVSESINKAKQSLYAQYQAKSAPLEKLRKDVNNMKWWLSAFGWASNLGIVIQMATGYAQRLSIGALELKEQGKAKSFGDGLWTGAQVGRNWFTGESKKCGTWDTIGNLALAGGIPIGALAYSGINALLLAGQGGSPWEEEAKKNQGLQGLSNFMNNTMAGQALHLVGSNLMT